MNKVINDITKKNLALVPAKRGSNPIQWIVIHYLGVANKDNPNLYKVDGKPGYGGHFNIQRDGQIFKAADPDTAVVWHCGGSLQGKDGHKYYQICTNYNSIGIENGVNYENGKWYFTHETQESLIYLVAKLMEEYKIDLDHVIRHFDVTGKKCPAPYVQNDGYKTSWTWNQFKANLKNYINQQKNKKQIEIITADYPNTPFPVRVKVDNLNIRTGPGEDFEALKCTGKGTFTIVERVGNWGKLKSGAGWIFLKNPDYCECVGEKQISYKCNNLQYNLVFDPIYYSDKYADLKKAFGVDNKKLFIHFCNYGMKEGRQAIETFNVLKYKNNYVDLQKAFGPNLPLYYKHYIQYGYKEKRKCI